MLTYSQKLELQRLVKLAIAKHQANAAAAVISDARTQASLYAASLAVSLTWAGAGVKIRNSDDEDITFEILSLKKVFDPYRSEEEMHVVKRASVSLPARFDAEVSRLLRSGAVNEATPLSSIIAVALENIADRMAPLSKEAKKEVRNLRRV